MKIFKVLFILLFLVSAVVAKADYDAAQEAQEAKVRAEAEARQRQQQAEMQQLKSGAAAKANAAIIAEKRKSLGSSALGKTDAEVDQMFEQRNSRITEEAQARAGSIQKELSHGQGAKAVKDVTGKSMDELMNMSDQEAEALAAELEKKYGGQ